MSDHDLVIFLSLCSLLQLAANLYSWNRWSHARAELGRLRAAQLQLLGRHVEGPQ